LRWAGPRDTASCGAPAAKRPRASPRAWSGRTPSPSRTRRAVRPAPRARSVTARTDLPEGSGRPHGAAALPSSSAGRDPLIAAAREEGRSPRGRTALSLLAILSSRLASLHHWMVMVVVALAIAPPLA